MNPFKYKRMLIHVYEILMSADTAMPKSALLQKANVTPGPIFHWMLEKGLITKTTAPRGLYRGSQRHRNKHIKGWYVIADRGQQVLQLYDRLFDVLWLSDVVKDRKMGIHRV